MYRTLCKIAKAIVLALMVTKAAAALPAEEFEFALLTDVHVSEGAAAEATLAAVEEINRGDAEFVIFAGDLATTGGREELEFAKSVLDKLEKPLFSVPGNHESTWNDPQSYSFPEFFGAETFVMKRGNLLFVGIPSGPWFKMSDGYIRKSDLAWLDAALRENLREGDGAVIVCHYPATGDLSNASGLLAVLAKYPVKAILSGHYHGLGLLNVNGLKNIVGRAVSLRHSNEKSGGYTLIRTDGEHFTVWNKTVGEPLPEAPSFEFYASDPTAGTPAEVRPDAPNDPLPPNVTRLPDQPERVDFMPDQRGGKFGRLQAPPASRDGLEYFCSWDGGVYCFDASTGQTAKLWRHPRGGGIYAPGNVTPVVGAKNLAFTAPDRHLTIIDRATGSELLRTGCYRFREGLGGSADGLTAYAKTMDGELVVVDVDNARVAKVINMGSGYDHTPVPPLEMAGGRVLVGTRGGGLVCVDTTTGQVAWKTRLGATCVDSITPLPDGGAEVVLIDGSTFKVIP